MNNIIDSLSYNSVVILTYFFLSLLVVIINYVTHDKANKLLFSCYRSSPFNPLTYVRFFTHILGHSNWQHFMNNFLYILLIGPMIEEKFGSLKLLIMILITAFVTGLINSMFTKYRLLGASGIVYMFIILSSFVNIQNGKIPLTLILIFMCYIVNEIVKGLTKKDNVSHSTHLLGALCGVIFMIYYR